MAWYPDGVPDWLTKEELQAAKYNIDTEYQPFVAINNLNESIKETTEGFYTRNYDVLRKIIDSTGNFVFKFQSKVEKLINIFLKCLVGNVLIVAHATTLDTCTRQLIGEAPRNTNELRQVIHKIPYCSLANVEEIDGQWKLVEPDTLPVTHSKNPRFEWNALTAT